MIRRQANPVNSWNNFGCDDCWRCSTYESHSWAREYSRSVSWRKRYAMSLHDIGFISIKVWSFSDED